MKKDLLAFVESVSLQDLKSMVSLKGRLDELAKKRTVLEKDLASINKRIASLESLLSKGKGKVPRMSLKKTRRKRIIQPPLSSLVVDILKEKKKPLKIDEICNALLNEKKYQTQAKNFKGNVRILLYVNEKGLFKKVKPGVFALAGKE